MELDGKPGSRIHDGNDDDDDDDDDDGLAAAVDAFRRLIMEVCGEASEEPRRRMLVANFFRGALGMEVSTAMILQSSCDL